MVILLIAVLQFIGGAILVMAARMGKLDMAVGNIFGANMYNMFILGILILLISPGLF